MKWGPAENMTLAVLKELLKDKGMAFSSKAKKKNLSIFLMPLTIPLVDLL